jgi:hypothetical protein
MTEQIQAALKRLEDDVWAIRQGFEGGMEARNSGARVAELGYWAALRADIASARIRVDELKGLLP